MNNESGIKTNQLVPFILGGITGGILALLFAPCSGKELRQRINSGANDLVKSAREKEEEIAGKAKKAADNLIVKAIQLAALTDKYASGVLDIPAEKIELEIKSLKAAIDAAVKTYKGKNGSPDETSIKTDIIENVFSDYDNVVLPKREGMRRRFNLRFR